MQTGPIPLRRLFWLLGGLLLLGPAAPAQTALIAHRSHGGVARTFMPGRSVHNFGEVLLPVAPAAGAASDNFGRVLVEEAGEKLTVTKVVRRADGKVFRYGVSDVQGAVVDTFSQGFPFTDPAFTTKDAKAYFGPGVEIVGFDRRSKAAGRAVQKAQQPVPAGATPDTAQPTPATTPGPAARRRRGQLLPAALPPNRTGPTLLLVLAAVATAGLLWRGAADQPRTA